MQNFQPILIAIGVLAIVGVLIHGFLLSKKEQESMISEEDVDSDLDEEQDMIHDEPYATMVESDVDAMEFYGITDEENEEIDSLDLSLTDDNTIDENDADIDDQDSFTDSSLSEDEIIDDEFDDEEDTEFDDSDLELNSTNVPFDSPTADDSKLDNETILVQENLIASVQNSSIDEPTDIFIFNVVARDGSKLGGHELLQFFLTSGFRYGDMNIFHRHENSDGTGEVLFSIANMMAPGTFDLDSMEQFQSKGISFFLTAPNDKIDIKKAFDLMLRAVVQIADEFHCDVLNEKRGILTEAQFIEYRSRLLQYT